MSEKERVRRYTEELIIDCIDEIASEGVYFKEAYALMSGALVAAEIVHAITAFEEFEIRTSILDSRLRYLENIGGEMIGI